MAIARTRGRCFNTRSSRSVWVVSGGRESGTEAGGLERVMGISGFRKCTDSANASVYVKYSICAGYRLSVGIENRPLVQSGIRSGTNVSERNSPTGFGRDQRL